MENKLTNVNGKSYTHEKAEEIDIAFLIDKAKISRRMGYAEGSWKTHHGRIVHVKVTQDFKNPEA